MKKRIIFRFLLSRRFRGHVLVGSRFLRRPSIRRWQDVKGTRVELLAIRFVYVKKEEEKALEKDCSSFETHVEKGVVMRRVTDILYGLSIF